MATFRGTSFRLEVSGTVVHSINVIYAREAAVCAIITPQHHVLAAEKTFLWHQPLEHVIVIRLKYSGVFFDGADVICLPARIDASRVRLQTSVPRADTNSNSQEQTVFAKP